jgi:hypothetical protein
MMIICCTVFGTLAIVEPEILQIHTTYTGEVTSTSTTNFIIQTTTINFKDGSGLTIYGIHNITIGTHTFKTVSSWLGIQQLIIEDD